MNRSTNTLRSAMGWAIACLLAAYGTTVRSQEPDRPPQQAKRILQIAGVTGGLVVHLGCGDGQLTCALHASDAYVVQGLDEDDQRIALARASIRQRGIYGPVSIDRFDGRHLPYVDNLVNLVVAERLGAVASDEVMRVLAPGGVACVKRDGRWSKTIKARPEGIDQWTHFLHGPDNNAVANDTQVGPPRCLQWVAEPLYARSHEIDSSLSAMVSAGGRLFYIYDEQLVGITDPRLPPQWSLIARDAMSGVLLWKRPISRWGWRQWNRAAMQGKDWTTLSGLRGRAPASVARRLVAVGDRLYTTLGYVAPLSILDASTGRTLVRCEGTEGTDEILCSEGLVVVCVRDLAARQRQRRTGKPAKDTVVAVNGRSGEVVWRAPPERVAPMTLAASHGRVFFKTGSELVCLDLKTGAPQWRAANKGGGTLVAQQRVVLVRSDGRYEAFSTTDGKRLWRKEFPPGSGAVRADLLVVQGLVWHGWPVAGLITDPASYWDQPFGRPRSPQTGVHLVGLDPLTGQPRRTIDIQNLVSAGHHFRCYRSKATERYILWPKRGDEFIDLEGNNHMRNDWLRGPCKYGIMPCNGLLYVPPNQCFCYTGVNQRGFSAVSAGSSLAAAGRELPLSDRLRRGPAYGKLGSRPADHGSQQTDDWPTFRHDPQRRGSTSHRLGPELDRRWQVQLGGRLTQPVAVDGRVYVAQVDAHTIQALDGATGQVRWQYTAGGRIDSPPTVHDGLLLFGSAAGRVTCLRAVDGRLVWRFQAAPADRRVVAFGQVESAWPVHGSVLVLDDLAYVVAGRSSFLDGGLYLYALDPKTGEVIHRGRAEGPYPDLSKDIGEPFSMPGTFSDVLVTDGKYLYIQQVVSDRELRQVEPRKLTHMGDEKFGQHVFSTAGFLDDSWWNRTFWMYGERYPGFYMAQQAPKSGQLLVVDDTTTYAVKCYTKRNVHSPMFFPATGGYLLMADDNDNQPILYGEPGAPKPLRWLPQQHARRELQLNYRAVNFDKGVGLARAKPPKWSQWVPVRIRAMVVAGDTLFIAGPPDVLDPKDPLAAFQGRKGARLWAVSATDGQKLAELELSSPPVFDGMIVASQHLYVALKNGSLVCLGGHGGQGRGTTDP